MRRAAEEGDADAVRAASAGRAHPVFGLWRVSLKGDLERAMGAGVRKIDAWTARHRLAEIDYAAEPVDPFFNANRPEDLATAARWLADGAAR